MASAMASVATWNIAAINNNPFEYWVTYADAEYIDFMRGVEKLLGQDDRAVVEDGFTETMFRDLINELRGLEVGSLEEIERLWNEDISKRRMVQGFLKDKSIGDKRLASVPDRITNTIHLVDGSTLKRPTVINAFAGSALSSTELWWEAWKKFMFHTKVEISFGNCETKHQMVWSLIGPIPRSKYPAITPEEQAISVQLQILYLAILDAVFVFIANRVAPGRWEKIRQNLCEALIYNKDGRVCDILAASYKDEQVVFLQEASAAFVHKARNHRALTDRFKIILPTTFNGKRGQNSIILVSRAAFDISTAADVTDKVLGHIDGNFLEAGDLFALRIDDVGGQGYLLVSFHGDSNGLSTRPVLEGLHEAFIKSFSDLIFVAGIDSNTSSQASDKFHHGVRDFRALLEKQGMVSVWDKADDRMITTTCSARTSLQMQLNKAVSFKNRFSKANMLLKDWILAYGAQVEEITDADRDNTGERRYVGETMLPTTSFPSDHAIVSCRVKLSLSRFDLLNSSATPSDSASSKSKASTYCERPRSADQTLYDYWGLTNDNSIRSLVQDSEFDPCAQARDPHRDVGSEPCEPLSSPRCSSKSNCDKSDSSCHRARRFSRGDLKYCSDLMMQESSVWILFSSRPLSAALTKGRCQILLLMWCSLGMFDVYKSFTSSAAYSGVYGNQFRLNLGHRGIPHVDGIDSGYCGPGSCACTRWIEDLEVFGQNAHCSNQSASAAEHPNPIIKLSADSISFSSTCSFNVHAVFSPPDVVWVHGLSFTTHGLENARLLQFELEVSTDGSSWFPASLPPWTHIRYSSGLRTSDGSESDSNSDKGLESMAIEVSLLPYWQWTLDWCIGQGKMWVSVFLAVALGWCGKGRWGTLTLSLNFVLNSLAYSFIVISYCYSSKVTLPYGPGGQTGGFMALRSFLNFLIAAMVAHEGHFLIDISSFMGGVLTGMNAYTRVVGLLASPNPHASQVAPVAVSVTISLFTFGLFIAIQIARSRVKRWISSELIKHDRDVFDALWSNITSNDAEVSALNRLRLLTRPMSLSWSKDGPRQLSASKRQGRPVTSLEDLYTSAFMVDPLLQAEAETLAREAGGVVVTDQSSRLGMDPSSRVPEQGMNMLKPWVRSVEKVVRSYDGDPSRLLDCCRCGYCRTPPPPLKKNPESRMTILQEMHCFRPSC
mmetsp:Transcript_16310/g.44255  ORF Transcript_16310/g.44255 Transcript_16310/m.44255 type:complete len:1173 (+) Transcript_16310:93-3611(+)